MDQRTIFARRARGKRRLALAFHYLYLSVLCASLNTTCSIRKATCPPLPPLRLARVARIFIFHFNFHFQPLATHVHEKGRTLGHSRTEFIHSERTTGRRDGGEFTSAGRPPVDSSCAAKLFSSNYYRPRRRLMTPSSHGDAILKIFSKVTAARLYYERKRRRGRIFLRRERERMTLN